MEYDFDGELVTLEYRRTERDCDGIHDHEGMNICHVDRLANVHAPDLDLRFPQWEDVRSRQRDRTAEASGF